MFNTSLMTHGRVQLKKVTGNKEPSVNPFAHYGIPCLIHNIHCQVNCYKTCHTSWLADASAMTSVLQVMMGGQLHLNTPHILSTCPSSNAIWTIWDTSLMFTHH